MLRSLCQTDLLLVEVIFVSLVILVLLCEAERVHHRAGVTAALGSVAALPLVVVPRALLRKTRFCLQNCASLSDSARAAVYLSDRICA